MDICRVCLSSGANKNICQTQAPKNQGNQSFMNVLKFCLDIQVIEDSKVTTMVCLKCYKKVLSFHKFKSLAMKNDAYLRSLDVDVYLTDSIKIEETEIEENTLEVDSLNLEMKSESGHEECVDDGKELESDDELLSVIKNIKYEYVEEIKEIAPIIKKRGRPKIIKNNVEKKKLEVCDECGKSVRNLKDHMNVHLPPLERRSLKCKVCERVFSSHSARHKHHKIKHLGIKNHCNICDKDIVATLKHHMLIKHRTHELPHACASCERRFISRSALESHITTHTKDRPFECFDCGKAFRLKVVLVHHRRQVHEQEKSHLCQFCSKSFYKKYHLQVHLRSHTKEKPYTCPECGKCFSTTTVLKNHRLVHSDLKNFQCSLCDASFRRLGYLRNHMLSHTKEKRHPCKYCGQRFGRSDHRKRHEFTAHEKNLTAA